jgi:two-component system phosphate regulon sensor histidine kinase PhoR
MQTASTERIAGAMGEEARLVAVMVAAAYAGNRDLEAVAREAADALGARVVIVAATGDVIEDSAAPAAGAAPGRGAPASGADPQFLWASAPTAEPPGATVRVGRPLVGVDAARDHLRNLVLGATLAAIVLVAVVGVVVAGRIGEPLEDLRQQAAAVARGRLDVAVRPAATRELGELGRAFNAMTGRLRSSLDELARTRGRLEATLANLSDGVAIVDLRGVVLLLNPAARRMLGATGATAGRPFVEVGRDHELDALVRSAARQGDDPRTATIRHGRSGRTIDATAQRVASGDESLVILVLRDVTDLRRLENVRREFVANVSHELRTPLASIRLVVETLEAGAIEDPAVAYGFLQRIGGETDRLALLVDDLLDLARLESGRVRLHVEPIPAADLVAGGADRLRPMVERARLSLVVEAPPNLPVVNADRARIEQVLLNLIHNAIKFTPPGGEIRITARPLPGAVEIAVSDNGIGVAPDELPRLFERFYKADKARRSEGTGLGLAIAKHIVLAHGGTIAAASTLGQGATFSVTLPLGGPPVAHEPARDGVGFPGTMR